MAKRTDALSIPQRVKEAVAARDSIDGAACCVLCGKPAPSIAPTSYSCAHYISRAQGGLGIEENILTLCPACHREYDGARKNELKPILRKHLKDHYENWKEVNLIYRKGESLWTL
jgi:5-methylcytosine-specific restriction endonuclease McrA